MSQKEMSCDREGWRGEERRHPDGLILSVMKIVREEISEMSEREDERHRKLDARIDSLIMSVNSYMEKTFHINEAFPDGDYEAHRTAHEAWIAETKRRKEFWEKLLFELTKWGLIGFCGWLVIQIWNGALKGPH